MKTALRSNETEMFFRSDGNQTKDINEAQAFDGFTDAVEFCQKFRLKDTELVFRTGRPEDDLCVSVNTDSGTGQIVKWWTAKN
jgi:hypothetical protein